MNTQIQTITNTYIQKNNDAENNRKKLEAKIIKKENQITRLQKRKLKIGFASWTDELLRPIVDELAHITNRISDDSLIPCGIQACVTVILENKEKSNCLVLKFIPLDLDKGEIGILDLNNPDLSMGRNNRHDTQYPIISLPATYEEMLKYSIKED